MLWDKNKFSIRLHGGRGFIKTEPMHGLIKHLIVIPEHEDTVWSMEIKDGQGDSIFDIKDIDGRLDDRNELPVGVSQPEKLDISIYDSTSNENFDVIFKVMETR